jgi:hypothetical protein
MSISAILPISTIDFNSTTATPSEKTVFQNVFGQLEQSVTNGDLATAQTLLNTISALSPSSASQNNALGVFLTNLTTALSDGSTSEATSALTTYQNASGTNNASSTATAAPSAISARATAAAIASQLIQSQNQLLLDTAFKNLSAAAQSSSTSSSSSNSSLYGLLSAAYGNSSSSSSASSSASSTSGASATSTTPYDTLVSSIQASLAAGDGTLTPALAYLQASGNFVSTSA